MSDSRPSNPGQVSTNLPGLTHYLTGHDESTGQAIVHSVRPAQWTPLLDNKLGFNVVYTTSQFPVDVSSNADIVTHDDLVAGGTLGLTNRNGTVARIVDFAPGTQPLIHRTQSLDYGIVIEGTLEMVLDSGETKTLHRGDVAVQRATMHGWRNLSETEWARMFFVLQHCDEVRVAGKEYTEDLGIHHDVAGIPSSHPGAEAGAGVEPEPEASTGAEKGK